MTEAVQPAGQPKVHPEIAYHQLLSLTIKLGVLLLTNGAEIYRVEESMQRILNAYGIETTDVFAIPNLIIISMETPEQATVTKSKRVYTRATNYDIVCEVNDYVRQVCAEKPPLADIDKQIKEIRNRPIYGFPMQLFAAAMVGFAFTLFFGGTLLDALVGMSAVLLAKALCIQMERFHANSFFVTVVASFIHTTVVTGCSLFIPGLQLGKIITGTLMILVPGVAFTTAIRDVIARDLLAGMVAGIECLLVGCAIAIGSAVGYWAVSEGWQWLT